MAHAPQDTIGILSGWRARRGCRCVTGKKRYPPVVGQRRRQPGVALDRRLPERAPPTPALPDGRPTHHWAEARFLRSLDGGAHLSIHLGTFGVYESNPSTTRVPLSSPSTPTFGSAGRWTAETTATARTVDGVPQVRACCRRHLRSHRSARRHSFRASGAGGSPVPGGISRLISPVVEVSVLVVPTTAGTASTRRVIALPEFAFDDPRRRLRRGIRRISGDAVHWGEYYATSRTRNFHRTLARRGSPAASLATTSTRATFSARTCSIGRRVHTVRSRQSDDRRRRLEQIL